MYTKNYIAVMGTFQEPRLPKIHKPNNPLRIIISSNDSPLYFLAKHLHKIITDNIPKTSSHIENSFQLVERLKGILN